MPMYQKHYPSVREYCRAAAEKLGLPYDFNGKGLLISDTELGAAGLYSTNWSAKGIRALETGTDEGADLVDKYMNQVMQNLPTFSRQWTQEVAGFLPNVPAYLAGDPASMWNMRTDRSENSPVRIFVNILPSSSNTREQVLMRGAAICALALVLQQKRSIVRISPYADLGHNETEHGAVISFDLSSPLSTSELLAALADNHVRSLSGAFNGKYTSGGGWVLGHDPTRFYSDALCKKHLNASPDDIVVPAIHAWDTLLRDPIAWIHQRLEPYMTEEVYN